MSRTFRRNKKTLIDRHVGTRDENLRDSWWILNRFPTCTAEKAYEKAVARYTRDHHSGHYGVPRWFRRQHGSKQIRLNENHKLHRYLLEDRLEAHAPENRVRDAKWYWW